MLAELRHKYADYLELCEQNLGSTIIELQFNQNIETSDFTAT
jgi:hypothetical protein